MTSFEVSPPDRRLQAGIPSPRWGGSYSIHPLQALDGIVLYVTLNGEAVGAYFGTTEKAASEAVADALTA